MPVGTSKRRASILVTEIPIAVLSEMPPVVDCLLDGISKVLHATRVVVVIRRNGDKKVP